MRREVAFVLLRIAWRKLKRKNKKDEEDEEKKEKPKDTS
jgi:hypothetical protein